MLTTCQSARIYIKLHMIAREIDHQNQHSEAILQTKGLQSDFLIKQEIERN